MKRIAVIDRVALTSIHHGDALRWKGFPGDATLTPESSRALALWLRDHGIPDQRAASESALDKARGTGK